MVKIAVFLHGPIGVGKTTIGQALAHRLGAVFIEADEFGDKTCPWFASILSIMNSIKAAVLCAPGDFAVVAYPLRAREHFWLRVRLSQAGTCSFFVGLEADLETILSPARRRRFTDAERCRISEMIEQGYTSRGFSNIVIDTGTANVGQAVAIIEQAVRALPNP